MNHEDRLIYLVFTAQQKLRTYLNQALARAGVKITIAQSGILFLLKQQTGRTMSELSQIIGTDNSTMTGMIDRLEKAGYVTRNSNPDDRRLSHIYISHAGIQEVNKAKSLIRTVNEEIKAGFSEQEMIAFKKVLSGFFTKFNRR